MLLRQFGDTVVPPPTGRRGRPRKAYKQWPKDAVYATVTKTYRKGRVAAVDRKLVHGTEEELAAALDASSASTKINTAFVERQNGTDRSYNARKARKTYEFSKDLLVHVAVTRRHLVGDALLQLPSHPPQPPVEARRRRLHASDACHGGRSRPRAPDHR